MSKRLSVNREELRRLHDYANTIHSIAETTKVSSLTESQRVKIEHIADFADQLQHGLKNMFPHDNKNRPIW